MRLPWLSRFLPSGDDIKSLDPRDLTLSWQLPSLDPCAPWIPYVLRYCPCERLPGLRAWGRDFLVVSMAFGIETLNGNSFTVGVQNQTILEPNTRIFL